MSLVMLNQYCQAAMNEKCIWFLGDIFGQNSPNLHDSYYTVLPYCISRHTVVCHAAQEVGAPHREYQDTW